MKKRMIGIQTFVENVYNVAKYLQMIEYLNLIIIIALNR